MIDIVIKLIDRLIQLRGYQSKRLRQVFDEVVEPTYRDLELVHADYLKIFEDIRSELVAANSLEREELLVNLKQVGEDLRRRRLELEPVRERLRSLKVDDSNLPEPTRGFLRSIDEYFDDPRYLYPAPT